MLAKKGTCPPISYGPIWINDWGCGPCGNCLPTTKSCGKRGYMCGYRGSLWSLNYFCITWIGRHLIRYWKAHIYQHFDYASPRSFCCSIHSTFPFVHIYFFLDDGMKQSINCSTVINLCLHNCCRWGCFIPDTLRRCFAPRLQLHWGHPVSDRASQCHFHGCKWNCVEMISIFSLDLSGVSLCYVQVPGRRVGYCSLLLG